MKTIDMNELRAMYQAEVDEAYMRGIELMKSKNITNNPLNGGYVMGMEWNNTLNEQLDGFDEWVDKSNEQTELEDVIIQRKTDDKDLLNVAREDIDTFRNIKPNRKHNKRERAIRKIMRDDAKRELEIIYPFSDLNNEEEIKKIWLNCKVQIRNDINGLLDSIGTLREIEKYIRLNNSYNQCK